MNHATRVYDDIIELLPSLDNPTPLVRINRLGPAAASPGGAAGAAGTLYAKLEWVNPFGSVKDRAASYLLMDLARRGEITQGRGVVEPTSGNTGISMAGIA